MTAEGRAQAAAAAAIESAQLTQPDVLELHVCLTGADERPGPAEDMEKTRESLRNG